ncbi:ECF-type sigma factor [Pirellulaceae bacterium SH467]|jgi:RNA polymerase sigma factor (TIGR02999 family)
MSSEPMDNRERGLSEPASVQPSESSGAGSFLAAGLNEFQISMVYNELRSLAAKRLTQCSPSDSMHATALVHEAYLRLVNASIGPHSAIWSNRELFFAAAAEAMRRVVIDYYRSKRSWKRGGKSRRVDAELDVIEPSLPDIDVLALNDALDLLEAEHPEKAQLVKMKTFGGMSMEECAGALGVSLPTVGRYWRYAKAFLAAKLKEADD